jgi:hypothetical protein
VFTGAIPKPCIEQAFKIVPLSHGDTVFVCCSGSFRLEQAVMATGLGCPVHSNDVSLLSVMLGRHLTGAPVEFRFKGRLEPLEDALPDGGSVSRLGAIGVALELAKYKGNSEHARAHFGHLMARADEYVTKARDKVAKYCERVRVTSFFAGDFRDHAERAIARGAVLFAWPPTYRGGYERLYKFLHDNVEWHEPSYRLFDPKDLDAWIRELDRSGIRYCVCADHALEGRKARAVYESGRNKPVFLYASDSHGSSVRRNAHSVAPIGYRLVDPAALRESAKIRLVKVPAPVMNFIKDRFLKPGLVHSDGMMRFVVLIDGKLAGGFIYARDSSGTIDWVYLLCDFSVAPKSVSDRKLSKLIAMLATGREAIGHWNRARMQRTTHVFTTAFTDQPASMKYRGIFKLHSKKPGVLNYSSDVRDLDNDAIYRDWFKRYAGGRSEPRGARDALRGEAARGAPTARKEPALPAGG